jgi:hypothetical protein
MDGLSTVRRVVTETDGFADVDAGSGRDSKLPGDTDIDADGICVNGRHWRYLGAT